MTKTEIIAEILREQEGATVEVVKIVKGGTTVQGLQIGTGSVRPVVYPEMMTGSYDEIVDKIVNIANEQVPQFEVDALSNWDEAKDKLTICVRPVNDDDMTVTMPFLDLEAYVYLHINDERSARVTQPMLDAYGICKELLFDQAVKNSSFRVISMAEQLLEILPEGVDKDVLLDLASDDENGVYVGGRTDGVNGAGILMKPDKIKQLADKLDSDLYIIPSSIHEVLMVKTSVNSLYEIEKMVKEINETEVAPQDRLSNNVYRYYRREGIISFA